MAKASKPNTETSKDSDVLDEKGVPEEDISLPEPESKDVVEEPSEETGIDPDTDAETDENDVAPETEIPPQSEEPVEAAEVAPVVPSEQPPRRAGVVPLVLGGVVAALLGFIAGRADQFDQLLPASLQRKAVDLSEVEAQTAALSAQNEAIEGRIDALQPTDLSGVEQTIADLEARLTALESRPVADVEGATSEVSSEIATLQATVMEQQDRIAALSDEVTSAANSEQTSAQKILARAALARVSAALESGSGYEAALADLEETGVVSVPAELSAVADEGVPSRAALADAFPEAARNALAAVRSAGDDGSVGLGGFLRRQLGARSVAPREGNDPDAILSRAEAAVKSGALDVALQEIAALPQEAQTEMSGWVEQAQKRQTALNAAEQLGQSLTTN